MDACCALHPEAAEPPVHSHQDHRHHHYHQVLHYHHHRRSPSAPPALLAVYDGGGDDVGAYADISPSAAGPRREASEAALEARLAAVEARLEAKAAPADAAGGGDAAPGPRVHARVQTMLLYDATSPTLLLHLGACVAVKMLQLVALQAVWQTIFFPMDFQRRGRRRLRRRLPRLPGRHALPVDYQSLFSRHNHNGGVGVDGVNWVVLFVLVFCRAAKAAPRGASERGARVRRRSRPPRPTSAAPAPASAGLLRHPDGVHAAAGSATFLISFKMQRYTTNGDFVTIDDDSPSARSTRSSPTSTTGCSTWRSPRSSSTSTPPFIVAPVRDRAKHRRAEIAVAVGRALFDFHFCALFRVCVVQYLIGRLFMFNQSTTTSPSTRIP
ncbi:hypothetical protein JL721_6124 [Aureococcus anophagefferens]|nr:hypothetical protein JL721_6124 [Aureococcus anophagefferens]